MTANPRYTKNSEVAIAKNHSGFPSPSQISQHQTRHQNPMIAIGFAAVFRRSLYFSTALFNDEEIRFFLEYFVEYQNGARKVRLFCAASTCGKLLVWVFGYALNYE